MEGVKGKHRRVGFRILSSAFSGAEITRRVGLDPSELGEPGQSLTPDISWGPVRRETVWVVDSPLDPPATVEERLAALLDVLEPKERQLSNMTYECLMHVFVGTDPVAHGSHPILLTPKLLERFAHVPGEGVLIEAAEAPPPEQPDGDFRKERTLSRHGLLHGRR